MATSRIFVRNLPPSFSEEDFKVHFSKLSEPTDVRFFGPRRIGYVGFKTAEEATSAVKHFNKSFIRLSKIGVELARPTSNDLRQTVPTARKTQDVRPIVESIKDTKLQTTTDQSLKRKRGPSNTESEDPKLSEFLKVMQPPSKSKRWTDDNVLSSAADEDAVSSGSQPTAAHEDQSDDEYQLLGQKTKEQTALRMGGDRSHSPNGDVDLHNAASSLPTKIEVDFRSQSDADWLMSRTNVSDSAFEGGDRIFSRNQPSIDVSLDDSRKHGVAAAVARSNTLKSDNRDRDKTQDGPDNLKVASKDDASNDFSEPYEPPEDSHEAFIRDSKRLFIRNLPYDITEDDLQDHFAEHGRIDEVHVSMDGNTGKAKGFAFISFADADSAVAAYRATDSQIYRGRLVHVLPASAKRETKLDEFALSKLPLKVQKQIQRKGQSTSSTFNWNSLYMNADAVVSSISARLGIDKSEVLDPTSSDSAVKQALAETHVIQEAKAYFSANGIDIEAFHSKRRGDTAILVKNFPYGTSSDELKRLFESHGKVLRLLMPPMGTIAIVEFAVAPEARAAYKALAYSRIKGSVLFLEFAPGDIFTTSGSATGEVTLKQTDLGKEAKPTVEDLLQHKDEVDVLQTTTLFVKNLNFTTTSEALTKAFNPLKGFVGGRVKTKPDTKHPGQVLSMGFGFLEFRTKEDAQAALVAMNGYALEGHKLDIRASQRALDAAEDRRKSDRAKALADRRTKIVIKNLPFETTKRDVRSLFSNYGQLRSVRVPKKFDSSSRGFAFAEFTTPREAANAIEALRNTHLLGRKLVLDFAEEEAEDAEAEIEKMQQKIGRQTDRVALQKMMGAGRRKFNAEAEINTDNLSS